MSEKFVPGAYMTENYVGQASAPHPSDVPPTPPGISASASKTGKPTKPPTAGKSPYLNTASFPDLQQGGGVPVMGSSLYSKTSYYLDNQPTLPGLNLADAMTLSPMVERVVSDTYPMNFAVMLLTILFIIFVLMRK